MKGQQEVKGLLFPNHDSIMTVAVLTDSLPEHHIWWRLRDFTKETQTFSRLCRILSYLEEKEGKDLEWSCWNLLGSVEEVLEDTGEHFSLRTYTGRKPRGVIKRSKLWRPKE